MIIVVVAGGSGKSAADILVIDDVLHGSPPVTQSTDVTSTNRMLVLPDRVGFHRCIFSSKNYYHYWFLKTKSLAWSLATLSIKEII